MVIWFNHWFSTAYHFIDMLKGAGYYVIASNYSDECIYKTNADEFFKEPSCSYSKYVDWCIDFCKKHDVKVFFPWRSMDLIVNNLNKFEEIGVNVVCEKDIEMFNTFKRKSTTLDFFKRHNICDVSEYRIISNKETFAKAYFEMEKYEDICVKYDKDEGGDSFKKILRKEKEPNMHRMRERPELGLSLPYMLDCLKTVDKCNNIIMMPYLEGPEISIDCIGFNNELLAIPRYKLNERVTKIDMDEKVINIAKRFYEVARLEGPFNIQLRYDDGKLFVLEVNTRLSGGCWKNKFIGCEFPVICVQKFSKTLSVLPSVTQKELIIANVENAIIL